MASVLLVALMIVTLMVFGVKVAPKTPWPEVVNFRPHLDHKPFFKQPFSSGEDVTKKCLECHKDIFLLHLLPKRRVV